MSLRRNCNAAATLSTSAIAAGLGVGVPRLLFALAKFCVQKRKKRLVVGDAFTYGSVAK